MQASFGVAFSEMGGCPASFSGMDGQGKRRGCDAGIRHPFAKGEPMDLSPPNRPVVLAELQGGLRCIIRMGKNPKDRSA